MEPVGLDDRVQCRCFLSDVQWMVLNLRRPDSIWFKYRTSWSEVDALHVRIWAWTPAILNQDYRDFL